MFGAETVLARRRKRAARFAQRPGQADRSFSDDQWREVPGTIPDSTVPSRSEPSDRLPAVDPLPDSTDSAAVVTDSSPTIDADDVDVDDLDVDDWEVAV